MLLAIKPYIKCVFFSCAATLNCNINPLPQYINSVVLFNSHTKIICQSRTSCSNSCLGQTGSQLFFFQRVFIQNDAEIHSWAIVHAKLFVKTIWFYRKQHIMRYSVLFSRPAGIDGNMITQVSTFKYIAAIITTDERCGADIKLRIKKKNSCVSLLWRIYTPAFVGGVWFSMQLYFD